MADDMQTLGILDEIQALVSDKLPVLSNAQAQPDQKKVQLRSPSTSLPSSHVVDTKSESRGTSGPGQGSELAAENDKVAQLPAAKKAVQSNKSSAKNGGALANMWGRVSTKPKADSVAAATSDATPNPAGNAAQICTPEGVEDRVSDDDDLQVSIRRTSISGGNRKRRVIFDFSDEKDEFKDVVNLASPDLPKQKLILGSKQSPSTLELEKKEVKKAKEAGTKSHEREREPLPISESEKSKLSSSEMISEHASLKNATIKDEVADVAPVSSKRRKVLKTRIDERGREVTEVVWEDEDGETNADSNTMKKADNKPGKSTGASYLQSTVTEDYQAKVKEMETPRLFNEFQQEWNRASMLHRVAFLRYQEESKRHEASARELIEERDALKIINERLEGEIKKLHVDFELAQKDRADLIVLRSKMDVVRAEADEWRTQMNQLASEKQAAREQLASVEAQLRAAKEKIEAQIKKIEELQSQVGSIISDRDNLTEELQMAKSKAALIKVEAEGMVAQYRADVEATSNQARHMVDLMRWQSRKEALEEIHVDLSSKIEDAKTAESEAERLAFPEEFDSEDSVGSGE